MADPPHFFVDRSLGRFEVPRLLREAGWPLTTLAEHYTVPNDEGIQDVEWLELVGHRKWVVLMKDDRIRRRPTEVAALKDAGVHAFCIANANLLAAEMARLFLQHEETIFATCRTTGPTLHSIAKNGLRPIDL